MRIPFTKAHGTKNDFLLTWANGTPLDKLPEVARAICDRHTGVGADGWMLVGARPKGSDYDGEIRLYNSDGSEAEISGNGTRCAAAFLIDAGLDTRVVRLRTAAGDRVLNLIERTGLRFQFEMGMGRPVWDPSQVRCPLEVAGETREVTILKVGNPQCAVFVDDFGFAWQKLGAAIEAHPLFPDRTNVSFIRVMDRHTLDVRFYERGAGETMSSGTGSTGAVWAAALGGLVDSPVRVMTPGGPLDVRWDDLIYLTGPAEIVAGGAFYFGD
jgi:diaminopimelate epimerase